MREQEGRHSGTGVGRGKRCRVVRESGGEIREAVIVKY